MTDSKGDIISVGIVEHSRFELHLQGDYEKRCDDGFTEYLPLTDDSYAIVDGVCIGIGFHWQQARSFILNGVLKVIEHSDGTKTLINDIPVEAYIKSVISSEMSRKAPLEFLKAHSVISRSWALSKILHEEKCVGRGGTDSVCWEDNESHTLFDVCADDHCQRYQGIENVDSRVSQAVNETAGLVLVDAEGNIADTRFSKCCGSKTELFSTCWQDVDYDYLISKDDPFCDVPEEKKEYVMSLILNDYDHITTDFYRWTAIISADDVRRRVKDTFGKDVGIVRELIPVKRGPSGRIYLLKIVGDEGSIEVGKELTIRRLLSDKCLYSSAFDVNKSGDMFVLNGRGWGHGVGLCQIGAAVMALEGYNWKEILEYYYPGTKLLSVGETR